MFQTAKTVKTICKSSLGPLLATEFDTDVQPCFSFSTFARLQLARHPFRILKGCVNFRKGKLKKGGKNTSTLMPDTNLLGCEWISSVQTVTSVLFFSEFAIILDRLLRSTLNVKEVRLQLFLLQESRRASICVDRMQPKISQVMPLQQRVTSQQERCLLRMLGLQTAKD